MERCDGHRRAPGRPETDDRHDAVGRAALQVVARAMQPLVKDTIAGVEGRRLDRWADVELLVVWHPERAARLVVALRRPDEQDHMRDRHARAGQHHVAGARQGSVNRGRRPQSQRHGPAVHVGCATSGGATHAVGEIAIETPVAAVPLPDLRAATRASTRHPASTSEDLARDLGVHGVALRTRHPELGPLCPSGLHEALGDAVHRGPQGFERGPPQLHRRRRRGRGAVVVVGGERRFKGGLGHAEPRQRRQRHRWAHPRHHND
mmetsp:Transcript_49492/g.143931  ORF Transcript_49492/g.143931 Transcript_49492/m.143931 type:complete len:263 (+) Transcript_49492:953-1741(+)